MTVEQVIERIRRFRRDSGWSRNRLARAAEVSEAVLRGMDGAAWSPTTTTLRKLEAVIDAVESAGGGNRAAVAP